MARVNRYANRSKISDAKFRQLVRLFAIDLDASQVALITGLNRNTVNRYLMAIRQRIPEFSEQQAPVKAKSNLMKATLGPAESKAFEVEGLAAKLSFWAS